MEGLIKLFFLFLIIIDPFGNLPLFVGVLRSFSPKEQRKIIFREMCFALLIMLFFFFFGNGFLKLLGVHHSSLQITGGIILFLVAVDMIFSTPKHETDIKKVERNDPLFVPLAIPAIAGPGILAILTVYSSGLEYSKPVVLGALLLVWIVTTPVLLLSPVIKKLLGETALSAIEQLFGFLVVLISLDMINTGLFEAFKN